MILEKTRGRVNEIDGERLVSTYECRLTSL